MPEKKIEGSAIPKKRRPSRCCQYCSGQIPLLEKQQKNGLSYHMEVRIDKDILLVNATLGYKICKNEFRYTSGKTEHVPVRAGFRIYCCPICGKRLGENARWAADDIGCVRCAEDTDIKTKHILWIERPAILNLGIFKRNILVCGNLGCEYKGKKDYVSTLDEIPINYCFICGDELPEYPKEED